MKTNKYAFLFWCLISVSCAKADWTGDYFCELDLETATEDQAVIIEHDLRIQKDSCHLSINGFQVADEIICQAKPSDGKISINFVSYANGDTKNIYGVSLYKVGEILFELKGSKDKLTTQWLSLHAAEINSTSENCFALEEQRPIPLVLLWTI